MKTHPELKLFRALTRLALEQQSLRPQLAPILRQAATELPDEVQLRISLAQISEARPDLVEKFRQARHEEGKSVDVEAWLREHGHADAADAWAENNAKYRDKFK